MATKNTKSAGNLILGQTERYWINAAKQFIWPIDLKDKIIQVPEPELSKANDDLMVSHFRSHGWHIQSCISVEYTKPFIAPESNGKPIFKPVKEAEPIKETKYKINQEFTIQSSDCRVKIVRIEKGKIQFKYLNRNKPDLLSSEENLDAVLRKGYWK